MSRRSEFRNEVKTRLGDRVYDAMQAFKQLHGIDSDSAAMARIAEQFLFGVIGTLPVALASVSVETAQNRTRVQA